MAKNPGDIKMSEKEYGSNSPLTFESGLCAGSINLGNNRGRPMVEENWHREIEVQIKKWHKRAVFMSEKHNEAGYYYKTRKVRYGLLPVILPLIMSPLSIIISSTYGWSMYFTSIIFAIIGLFTGLSSFFAPGEQMQQHFSFSSRYADIITDIEAEMVRYRQFRSAADVFILKIKMMIDNL